jgi:hypothetical protein
VNAQLAPPTIVGFTGDELNRVAAPVPVTTSADGGVTFLALASPMLVTFAVSVMTDPTHACAGTVSVPESAAGIWTTIDPVPVAVRYTPSFGSNPVTEPVSSIVPTPDALNVHTKFVAPPA